MASHIGGSAAAGVCAGSCKGQSAWAFAGFWSQGMRTAKAHAPRHFSRTVCSPFANGNRHSRQDASKSLSCNHCKYVRTMHCSDGDGQHVRYEPCVSGAECGGRLRRCGQGARGERLLRWHRSLSSSHTKAGCIAQMRGKTLTVLWSRTMQFSHTLTLHWKQKRVVTTLHLQRPMAEARALRFELARGRRSHAGADSFRRTATGFRHSRRVCA